MNKYNATFREILLSPSGSINDYAAHYYRKYTVLDGNNVAELSDMGREKLHDLNNQIKQTVKFYGRKSFEFGQFQEPESTDVKQIRNYELP